MDSAYLFTSGSFRVYSLFVIIVVAGMFLAPAHARTDDACAGPGEISRDFIDRLYETRAKTKDRARELLRRMTREHGTVDHERVREITTADYTHRMEYRGIHDQGVSGDCWIAAVSGMIRHESAIRHGVEGVTFSRAYMKFWHLFEQANTLLENVIHAPEKGTQAIQRAIVFNVEDGGLFHWSAYLLKKYGAVPQSAMPDTFMAADSRILLDTVNMITKKYAYHILINKLRTDEARDLKLRALADVWEALVAELGLPPRKFDFRLDASHILKDNLGSELARYPESIDAQSILRTTPHMYLRNILHHNPDDYLALGNHPHLPMRSNIIFSDTNLTPHSPNMSFINVPMRMLMQTVIDAVKNDSPVWVGVDFSRNVEYAHGIIDPLVFIRDHIAPKRRSNIKDLNRAARIAMELTKLNHAMLIVGFDAPLAIGTRIRRITPKHVTRFLLENSHGVEMGDGGFVHMSKEGFETNIMQIIVHKDWVPKDIKAIISVRPHQQK